MGGYATRAYYLVTHQARGMGCAVQRRAEAPPLSFSSSSSCLQIRDRGNLTATAVVPVAILANSAAEEEDGRCS